MLVHDYPVLLSPWQHVLMSHAIEITIGSCPNSIGQYQEVHTLILLVMQYQEVHALILLVSIRRFMP